MLTTEERRGDAIQVMVEHRKGTLGRETQTKVIVATSIKEAGLIPYWISLLAL